MTRKAGSMASKYWFWIEYNIATRYRCEIYLTPKKEVFTSRKYDFPIIYYCLYFHKDPSLIVIYLMARSCNACSELFAIISLCKYSSFDMIVYEISWIFLKYGDSARIVNDVWFIPASGKVFYKSTKLYVRSLFM